MGYERVTVRVRLDMGYERVTIRVRLSGGETTSYDFTLQFLYHGYCREIAIRRTVRGSLPPQNESLPHRTHTR